MPFDQGAERKRLLFLKKKKQKDFSPVSDQAPATDNE
jgi:hypothetical protein